MAKSASKVNVWNRALARIGETHLVEGENDETPAAEQCRIHWDDVVELVLEAFPWPFATTQAALSASTTTRTGWDYVYVLPADCVTPIGLLAEDERIDLINPDDRHPFKIQADASNNGMLLCCNIESGEDFDVLEYVAVHDYVLGWPRGFVDAVAWRLAVDLALAIPKDVQRAAGMQKQYEIALADAVAKIMNRQQHDPEPDPPSVAVR